MKVAYGSDLHLDIDVANLRIEEMPDADLLILAGDIIEIDAFKVAVKTTHPTLKQKLYVKFFKDISEKYKNVLWVFGNHEFWHGEFNFAHANARKSLKVLGIDNIYILDNAEFAINDVSFFGTTLWTSCGNKNPLTMYQVSGQMNDYDLISVALPYKEKRKFTVDDSVRANDLAARAIEKFAASQTRKSRVLITHHAMSFMSVHEMYRGDILNYAYANDLDNLLCYSDFKIAIHGHMHDEKDYMLGGCQVLVKPRGYFGQQVIANNYKFNTFEI